MALNNVGVRLVAESEQAFISALDNAAGAVKNLTDQAAGGFGFAAATDHADALTTAIGIGLYDAVKKVMTGLVDMGTQAFNTIADFERTTQSIVAMMAIEIGMGEKVMDVTQATYELTAADIESARVFDKAARSKEGAVERIRDAIERLEAEVAKDSANEDLPQKARLYADLEDAILEQTRAQDKSAAIRSKHGRTFEVETSRQINQVHDINEAMRLAKKPAGEMLDSLTRMALQSPFERKPILDVMKQGQAFGFTAKESLRATEAFIKFATVTGRSESHITRMGYAMGQMKSQGKVMTRQLRQMNMAGMGMNQMAQAMGMSTEEFTSNVSKGKIPFEEFNENLMALVHTKYTPAYQQINESFYGLQNAIKDINTLSLAAFWEGTMQAGKGIMLEIVRPFTKGEALKAIQGFGDRIGEALAPGLKVVADKVGLLMKGFMDLSMMINGPVNKEFTNATEEAAQAKTIIEELGVALTDTAADGISQSRAFADLTAKVEFAKTAQGNLKDEITASTGVNKAAQASHKALATIYTDEEKKLVALEKANKKGTREYANLTKAHENTQKELDELNTARGVTLADLNKLTAKEKANNAELANSEKALTALGDPLQNLSPAYQLLIDKKKILEKAGDTENETYKKIVAEMKKMEDGTVTYVETSKSLSETTELSEDLADKLALATIEQDKLIAAAGPIPESFMSKIIESFDEFIDKTGPVAAILLSLEDIFLKIKKKVTDAWGATKTFIRGIDPKKSGLWSVNDALKRLRDNFDKIWRVGENVVKVVVGLAFLNRIAGFVMTAAKALGFFLSPLGLITGAVGLLTWEYDKGNKGVVDFVDGHKASLDGWYANTKKMFDASTGEGKLFRENVQVMKNGVNRIFQSEFDTKLPVDMAIADMRRVNAEGFEDIRTGITDVGIQFGILPSTMDKIADLILIPIETIKGIIQGIYVAFKLGVIDEIVNIWESNPGEKEAQAAADKITDILQALLPEGWAKNIEASVNKIADIIGTLRTAFLYLKDALDAVEKSFKPFMTFLSENREKILPVLIALAEITTAVWLLNGALLGVTGISLASLATGLAPAAADAGALANLQLMRGKMGLETKAPKPGGGGGFLAGLLETRDIEVYDDLVFKLGEATNSAAAAAGEIADIKKALLPPYFDLAGYNKEMEAIRKLSPLTPNNMLMPTRAEFTLTGKAASDFQKGLTSELKLVEAQLLGSQDEIANIGKALQAQDAIGTSVWDNITKKSKATWASATDDISAYYNKAKGMAGSFDEAALKMGADAGVKTKSIPNPLEFLDSMKDARKLKAFNKETKYLEGLMTQELTNIAKVDAEKVAALQKLDDVYYQGIQKKVTKEMLDFDNFMAKQGKGQYDIFLQSLSQEDLLAKAKGGHTKNQYDNWLAATRDAHKEGMKIAVDNASMAQFDIEKAAIESNARVQKHAAEMDLDAIKRSQAKNVKKQFPGVVDDAAKGTGLIDDVTKVAGKAAGAVDNVGKGLFGTMKTTFLGGFDDLFLKAIPKLITGGIGGIWALIKAPFLAIAAGGGFLTFLAGIFTAGSGGFIAAVMAPMMFVVSEFIAILGFIGAIFSAIGAVITSPISWAILAIVAIMWGMYYDIGGITTAITEFLLLLLSPIYMLWNGFLVLSDVVTYVMMAIWERMVSVWESAIKPVFTMFNTAIAVLFDWMTWLLYPFIMFYNFIVKLLVPIIAVVFYATMMGAWYVIEMVIEIVMFVVKAIFAFFMAIYSIIKIIGQFIYAAFEAAGAIDWLKETWASVMAYMSGPETTGAFKSVMYYVTKAINWFRKFGDIIQSVINAFYTLSGALAYDWIGYMGARLPGGMGAEEFEAQYGAAPDVTFEWADSGELSQDFVEQFVTQAITDLTGSKVREPTGDESTLEALWLMATNAMKSPEEKQYAEDVKAAKAEQAEAKAAQDTKRDAGYEATDTAASDAARIAALEARAGTFQGPLGGPPAGGINPRTFVDPNMMGGAGRVPGVTGVTPAGVGYTDNSAQSQTAVIINNNNNGAPVNVSNQVGAALGAQFAAQSAKRAAAFASAPVSQSMSA